MGAGLSASPAGPLSNALPRTRVPQAGPRSCFCQVQMTKALNLQSSLKTVKSLNIHVKTYILLGSALQDF